MFREWVKRSWLYTPFFKARQFYRDRRAMRAWVRGGRVAPPPHKYKEDTVKDYARKFGLVVLVETGTFLGDMIQAMEPHFREIYSVELGEELHQAACRRFAGNKHVHLLQGDSASVLRDLLPKLSSPPLIWLDAHYSGDYTARGDSDTPILGEMQAVFACNPMAPVVLIDDARCFDGTSGYPTIADLRKMILKERPNWVFEVESDIIRIHPQPP